MSSRSFKRASTDIEASLFGRAMVVLQRIGLYRHSRKQLMFHLQNPDLGCIRSAVGHPVLQRPCRTVIGYRYSN
jgi:hypothetical protein